MARTTTRDPVRAGWHRVRQRRRALCRWWRSRRGRRRRCPRTRTPPPAARDPPASAQAACACAGSSRWQQCDEVTAGTGLGTDIPTGGSRESSREREPETRSVGMPVAVRLRTPARVEDALSIPILYAGAVVPDAEHHGSVYRGDLDFDRVSAVAAGVVEQRREDALGD